MVNITIGWPQGHVSHRRTFSRGPSIVPIQNLMSALNMAPLTTRLRVAHMVISEQTGALFGGSL